MNDRIKYPATMSGVLIFAAIAAQQQGLPRFLCLSRINILAHDPHSLINAELAAVD